MMTSLLPILFLQVAQDVETLFRTVESGSQLEAVKAMRALDQPDNRGRLVEILEKRWEITPVAGPERDGTLDAEIPVFLFRMKDRRADLALQRHMLGRAPEWSSQEQIMKLDLFRFAKIYIGVIEQAAPERRGHHIARFGEDVMARTDRFDYAVRKYEKEPDPLGHIARRALKDARRERRNMLRGFILRIVAVAE